MAPGGTPSTADGRTALCPGTYDPVTYGHLDIIERASGMFDRIVVGVVRHPTHKEPFFPIGQRRELLGEVLAPFPNVIVAGFSTLVVEYARAWGACALVKGLRAVSDFEWELQLEQPHRKIAAR